MKNLLILFFLLVLSSISFSQVKKKDIAEAKNQIQINKAKNINAASYDFTTGSDKYYGTNGAKEVEAGVWGMIAGDVNKSGIVTNSDVDAINADLNTAGYYDSDTNLSGIVSNSDVDLINSNLNKGTQVP